MAKTIEEAVSKYVFVFDITNSPEYSDITRKIAFYKHPVYELNGIREIQSKFNILHFNNGHEIYELERDITLYSDGIGDAIYPIDLDFNESGQLIGLDSELANDIDFFINWIGLGKSMPKLFQLMISLHDIRLYDKLGNKVGSESGVYTFFDCKYYRLFDKN